MKTIMLKNKVVHALIRIKNKIFPVVEIHDQKNIFVFDLSANNKELLKLDLTDVGQFTRYIFSRMREHNTPVAIGKYNENRVVYTTDMFKSSDMPRTVHLGIDLWASAGTPVFASLPGKIHSFNNNAAPGDYGPTIILEHSVDDVTFYTLYGHLTLDSIADIREGQSISGGQEIARIGNYPTNGNWPPHLHFQLITDMQGNKGDFPGVAALNDREQYLELCPDPNLILNIKALEEKKK